MRMLRNGCVTALALLVAGCATPVIKPADPQALPGTGVLTFLQDDVTTREQVLLKLGVPAAQVEGDRILMYQLRADPRGEWYLTAPDWDASRGLRIWKPDTSSLVLVFDDEGVLRRHSLVTPQAPR